MFYPVRKYRKLFQFNIVTPRHSFVCSLRSDAEIFSKFHASASRLRCIPPHSIWTNLNSLIRAPSNYFSKSSLSYPQNQNSAARYSYNGSQNIPYGWQPLLYNSVMQPASRKRRGKHASISKSYCSKRCFLLGPCKCVSEKWSPAWQLVSWKSGCEENTLCVP
jgi:hypothetical protein